MFVFGTRKRFFGFALASALLLGLTASSQAVITFSNITFSGTPNLISAATFNTGNFDIDFTLPNAVVGDFQVARQGVITITYEAQSNDPMSAMVYTLLGGVAGNGLIQFSEVVEDMITPGIIGTLPTQTITSNSQLPFSTSFDFIRSSTRIKVKKDFFLIAEPNSQVLDLARIAFFEQNISVVPEPASMAALGIGFAALVARRRRK